MMSRTFKTLETAATGTRIALEELLEAIRWNADGLIPAIIDGAAGGYARATLDDSFLDDEYDSDGYYAGLGYEVFLTRTLTAGAELLYHKFDDFEDLDDLGLPDVEAEVTSLSLSLNYRF